MPQRLSELGVYAGRLSLGVVAALVSLSAPRLPRSVKFIALICILSALLWTATRGYVRYAMYTEILGGLLLISLGNYLLQQFKTTRGNLRWAAASLPIILLLAQCVLSASYISKTEWSLRPISFDAGAQEVRWAGRDRELSDFQSPENMQKFKAIDAWIVSSVKTNGVEALLRPDVPMLGVNYSEYFDKPAGRTLFQSAIANLRGKRVYSLVHHDDLDGALKSLQQRNLTAGHLEEVIIHFYSNNKLKFKIKKILLKMF